MRCVACCCVRALSRQDVRSSSSLPMCTVLCVLKSRDLLSSPGTMGGCGAVHCTAAWGAATRGRGERSTATKATARCVCVFVCLCARACVCMRVRACVCVRARAKSLYVSSEADLTRGRCGPGALDSDGGMVCIAVMARSPCHEIAATLLPLYCNGVVCCHGVVCEHGATDALHRVYPPLSACFLD